MTFNELLTEVYNITNRSDLVAESTTAIRAAALKLHGMDYFYKDLIGTTLVFSTAESQHSFDYKALFPRWRNIKYLRKISGNEGADFINIIPPEFVVDGYNINRVDIAYMAGSVLNIRMSSSESRLLLGYYAHPSIITTAWSSWISEEIPYAIVFEAAATVFKLIGKDEEEIRMRRLLEGDPRKPAEGYYGQVRLIGLADTGGH